MDAVYCANSICGPFKAYIWTGDLYHINGFYKNVDGSDFDGSQPIYAEIFKDNGYQTAIIGKDIGEPHQLDLIILKF